MGIQATYGLGKDGQVAVAECTLYRVDISMLYQGLSGQIEYAKIKSAAGVGSVVKQGTQPVFKERCCE